MKKKFINVFVVFLFVSHYLFAQESLNKLNTSWANVISGKVLSEPAVSSFGFSIISDARTISTFSNSGNLLWEKSLANWRDAKIYTLPEDFYLIIKNNNRSLSLINPSGYEIWNRALEYPVFGKPLAGRDGRFFIRTIDSILCFGITGICKWEINIPKQSNIPMQNLPDGTFVTFLEKVEDGKSKGLRISPFGEILEEIIFAGEIVSANCCSEGVLVTFKDGAAGLFSLTNKSSEKQLVENKWVIKTESLNPDFQQKQKAFFLVSDDYSTVFYLFPLKNSVKLFFIDVSNGSSTYDFEISNIEGFNIKASFLQDRNILLTDYKNAVYYSEKGKNLWSGKLPYSSSRTIFDYLIFTKDNSLVLCNNDWSLDGYKLNQNLKPINTQKQNLTYKDFYNFDAASYGYFFEINSDLKSDTRIEDLKKGFYGKEEIQYVNQIIETCENYYTAISSKATNFQDGKSLFETNVIDVEKVMIQLSLFSDNQFNNLISKYLKTLNNRTILLTLLNGISYNGYDPDLQLLKALEVAAGKISYKDDLMLTKICDSIYSICVFMGRPAYNSKGKEILTRMLSANYSTKIRVYARDTLRKIMEIEI